MGGEGRGLEEGKFKREVEERRGGKEWSRKGKGSRRGVKEVGKGGATEGTEVVLASDWLHTASRPGWKLRMRPFASIIYPHTGELRTMVPLV
jgi:hypothetical protein